MSVTEIDPGLTVFRLMREVNQLRAERDEVMTRNAALIEDLIAQREELAAQKDVNSHITRALIKSESKLDEYERKAQRVINYCNTVAWERGNPAAFLE